MTIDIYGMIIWALSQMCPILGSTTISNTNNSLPFGIGARKCPGSRIASTELHMSLINLVRHFKLTHENPDKFPESSHDQSMLYIDSKKNPLYLIPRDHMKPILEKHVMI